MRILLHEPSLAARVDEVASLRSEDLPGATLLADLVETLHAHHGLSTGVLLEHFRAHEWARWLDVLAHRGPELSDPEGLRVEFGHCISRIREQVQNRRARRRLEELKTRQLSELSEDERREFAELTARRSPGRSVRHRHGDARPDDG